MDFSLEGVAETIRCPTLVTGSANDRFDPGGVQARALYDHLICEKELVMFSEEYGAGSHCQFGAFTQSFAANFDWLDEKMGMNRSAAGNVGRHWNTPLFYSKRPPEPYFSHRRPEPVRLMLNLFHNPYHPSREHFFSIGVLRGSSRSGLPGRGGLFAWIGQIEGVFRPPGERLPWDRTRGCK